jgi:hypothetical protein
LQGFNSKQTFNFEEPGLGVSRIERRAPSQSWRRLVGTKEAMGKNEGQQPGARGIDRPPAKDLYEPFSAFLVAALEQKRSHQTDPRRRPILGIMLISVHLDGLAVGLGGLCQVPTGILALGPNAHRKEGIADIGVYPRPVPWALLASADEQYTSISLECLGYEADAWLAFGHLAQVLEGPSEGVEGPRPIQGKLLAGVDRDRFMRGVNRFREQAAASVSCGSLGESMKGHSEVALHPCPILGEILVIINEERPAIGLGGLR